MATKNELLEQLQALGVEADASMTKSELEALLAENGGAGDAGAGAEDMGGGMVSVVLTGNATYGGVSYKAGERVTIKETECEAFAKAGLITSETVADPADTSDESDDADSDE